MFIRVNAVTTYSVPFFFYSSLQATHTQEVQIIILIGQCAQPGSFLDPPLTVDGFHDEQGVCAFFSSLKSK
ncbi:hypothetical protein EOPP23_09690 [Endozoicomonas sp. OPT23]|nr:hypothetical protein [Endozoicomonas sp. OPT23]